MAAGTTGARAARARKFEGESEVSEWL